MLNNLSIRSFWTWRKVPKCFDAAWIDVSSYPVEVELILVNFMIMALTSLLLAMWNHAETNVYVKVRIGGKSSVVEVLLYLKIIALIRSLCRISWDLATTKPDSTKPRNKLNSRIICCFFLDAKGLFAYVCTLWKLLALRT